MFCVRALGDLGTESLMVALDITAVYASDEARDLAEWHRRQHTRPSLRRTLACIFFHGHNHWSRKLMGTCVVVAYEDRERDPDRLTLTRIVRQFWCGTCGRPLGTEPRGCRRCGQPYGVVKL